MGISVRRLEAGSPELPFSWVAQGFLRGTLMHVGSLASGGCPAQLVMGLKRVSPEMDASLSGT